MNYCGGMMGIGLLAAVLLVVAVVVLIRGR
jgi:hypothetical protein